MPRQNHLQWPKSLMYLLISSFFISSSCAVFSEESTTEHTSPHQSERLVAIGDLHGDLDATRRALRLAGAINAQDEWTGENMTLVQVGDQLDRGDDEIGILELFEKIEREAQKAGGKVHILNGNHEIMNAQGDLRYVTEQGFKSFVGLPNLNLEPLVQAPDFARSRLAAFRPGGPYALKLAKRQTVLQLGDKLFAHGGLLPEHIDYGLERINREYSDWLQGKSPQLPLLLSNDDSPIWTRIYSLSSEAPDCKRLEQTLQKSGAKYLFVGHSVQKEINSACQGKVWRIDTGMSRYYGGDVQVLEFDGEVFRVLKETS